MFIVDICCLFADLLIFVFEFVGMVALRFLAFGFNLIGILLFTELLVVVGCCLLGVVFIVLGWLFVLIVGYMIHFRFGIDVLLWFVK